MAESKLTAFRCPADLLAAIEAEMTETGDSKTEVMVRRLRLAYGFSEETPAPSIIDKLRAEMEAAIAPILSRLENLERLGSQSPAPPEPAPKSLDTEETAPLLPFMIENQAIAIDAPVTMPTNADEKETTPNHPKPTPNAVTGDLSAGLSGKELATRFGYADASKVCRMAKKPDFTEWSKSKDPNGIVWRREGEGKQTRYCPLGS